MAGMMTTAMTVISCYDSAWETYGGAQRPTGTEPGSTRAVSVVDGVGGARAVEVGIEQAVAGSRKHLPGTGAESQEQPV